ncbi:hypothetical protein [Rhabdochlamydiaceae symbiont of Dictyostelium giganteum]|uniref:hypothetical protein n=1 Tax=Rhabdochlamydiaceae symbiont of Dictyostelium giganteum TaxID=3342349 RepID=UPI00385002BC
MKNLLSKACLLSAAWLTTLGAEAPQLIKPKPSVTPVESTPESDLTELRIAYPKNQVIDLENPVNVQMRLELYPLGFDSDFARAKEIRNSSEGQAIRVIIDDQPYLLVNQAIDDIMGSEEINLDQILMVKIPETLSSGEHIIRAYPVRSFGESLKNREAFATSTFYTGEKIVNASLDLMSPFLTYNEPQGHFDPRQPILLDFLVSNATLSSDGYKVRLTIDGSNERILTEWTPYYLYGLGSGSHTIKLELLDFENTVISPLFNDLEHTITIGL